jgi:hypothetical protein
MREKVTSTLHHAARAAREELKKLTLAQLMREDHTRRRLHEAEVIRPL